MVAAGLHGIWMYHACTGSEAPGAAFMKTTNEAVFVTFALGLQESTHLEQFPLSISKHGFN